MLKAVVSYAMLSENYDMGIKAELEVLRLARKSSAFKFRHGRDVAESLCTILLHAENEAIERRFKGGAGTFLLVADYNRNFYRELGYIGGELLTHDGPPFMVKHHKSTLV